MYRKDIDGKKEIVKKFVFTQYKIDTNTLPDINQYLHSSLSGIVSVKIWEKKFSDTKSFGPVIYVNETVSNMNQMILLGIIGFKIPAYILLRRSFDNFGNFIYYKDHLIEFHIKENDSKSKYLKGEELKQYFSEYPFFIHKYENFDKNECNKLIKELMKSWGDNYSDLSKYVHATNEQYFDMTKYLDEITPNDKILSDLTKKIDNFNSIFNTVNILFFFNTFKKMKEGEKSLIRNTIKNESHYKKRLIDIFGEL